MTFDRFQWLQGWVNDASLTTIAKACLAVLTSYMNGRGEAWPALPTIAEKAACSRRSAITHLAAAEEQGWVSSVVRPGRSTLYLALFPASGVQDVHHTRATGAQPVQDVHHRGAGDAPHPCNPCTSQPISTRAGGAPRAGAAPLPVQEMHHTRATGAQPVQDVHHRGAGDAPEATTTSSSSTAQEVEEEVLQEFARENFQPENEPDSLDAFLMHVAIRHGFLDISPAQAMGTASFLVSVFGTSDAAKTYASARFVEKDGAGLSLQTMIRILHQDAAGWKKRAEESQTQPNRGGQAPVQTSRLEVRNTEWSSLPETQAWFDTANHEKI